MATVGHWPWAWACTHFISILTRSNHDLFSVHDHPLFSGRSTWPLGLNEMIDMGSHGLCQVTPSSRV